MEFDTGRRRFLELAGTGTAISLAGCNALQEGTDSQKTTGPGTDTASEGANDTQKVVLSAQADQQKLQQRQREIQSALRSGNISRSQAQQRYRAAEQKLRANAVASFRERASSNPNLSVVDSVEQFGILLISGTPPALIETLSFASVNALLPQATFQKAKAQAQQQQRRQNSTSTESN